jgi:bifunctional non-homologous end joining protein LigD
MAKQPHSLCHRLKEAPIPVQSTSAARAKAPPLVLEGVVITHPGRVISRTGQITKGALAEYYAGVARRMLPRIVRRPLSLLRCPSGIDAECFYQRNPRRGLGPDVRPFEFRHKGKTYEYLYIEDERGLLELVQMGSVEIHPWGATIDAIDYPDRLIFDLDPAPGVPFPALKLAAEDVRRRLKQKGLGSVPKCTGGKGLHVIVPLAGKDRWGAVKAFAASIAHEMVEAAPEAYVATMTKAKRAGKIFIDYFRNDYTATAIADYGVRALPGAPVAVPLDWRELKKLNSSNQFTMKNVLERVRRKKAEPYSSYRNQRIPAAEL